MIAEAAARLPRHTAARMQAMVRGACTCANRRPATPSARLPPLAATPVATSRSATSVAPRKRQKRPRS
eukprot:2137014-Prymnesium_polylepis.2